MATNTNAPRPGRAAGAKGHFEADQRSLAPNAGRELSDEAVTEQAEALAAFIAKGGAGSRWLASKDLTAADLGAILAALADRDQAA